MRPRVSAVFVVVVLIAVTGCTAAAPPKPVISVQPLRAHAGHTATLLADGRVLVAGGCADDGCPTADVSPSSELYLPGRGFTAGPPMRHPRDSHTATTLADGRVLMVGGFSGEGRPPLTEAELFDANGFSDAGKLTIGRGGHVAARLPDGRVLIAGGWIGPRTYTASVEIYDPATATFTTGPAMPGVRMAAAAMALRDGRVLVTGGQDTPQRGLATALLYLPDANRWQPIDSMSTPRFKHAMAMLPDGRVLILGGTTNDTELLASTEVFDPATNRFTPGPTMTGKRYKFSEAVAVTRGGLLVAGGNQIETYDSVAGRFETVPGSQGVWRSAATATALPDGSVLVVGGYDERIHAHHDAVVIP